MSAMDILVGWIEILTAGDDRTKSPSPIFIANLIIQNIRAEEGSPAALTSDDMWFGDPKNMPPEDLEFFDLPTRFTALEGQVSRLVLVAQNKEIADALVKMDVKMDSRVKTMKTKKN
jgi:hypothetical protein